MDISIEKGQIKIIPVKQPGPKKNTKVTTNNGSKGVLQGKNLDKELIGMKDSELIRHTCREIIATKNNDPRLRLQASTIMI